MSRLRDALAAERAHWKEWADKPVTFLAVHGWTYPAEVGQKTDACEAATDHALTTLEQAVAFFASVIRSGEPWTAQCQATYDQIFQA